MNRRSAPPQRRSQSPAYRQALERLDAALEREAERRRNDANGWLQEEAKLTHARLALFGCAPK